MIILGLTGSIAMGKSTMAEQFKTLGIPIHDADQAVHGLMTSGGRAVEKIAALFPTARRADGSICRATLGRLVFSTAPEGGESRQKLEAILHPLVKDDRIAWLDRQKQSRHWCVGLDVPLLFETGGEQDCHATVLATASAYQQRRRALARDGMTEERFEAILALQVPDALKRKRADFIIPTDYGRRVSAFYIEQCLEQCRLFPPKHFLSWGSGREEGGFNA